MGLGACGGGIGLLWGDGLAIAWLQQQRNNFHYYSDICQMYKFRKVSNKIHNIIYLLNHLKSPSQTSKITIMT
jgi:hypothetical protein